MLLFESALKRRRRGSVIRLEYDSLMPVGLRAFIAEELGVVQDETFLLDGMLALNELAETGRARSARAQIQALQSALSRARA